MMSILLKTAAALVVLSAPFAAHAELIATPLPGDTRLVRFEFDPNNTYQVLTRPKSVTDIELEPGEVVKGMAVGDSFSWDCETGVPGHIFVRPKYDDMVTSGTVVTDKRTYQLMLRSTSADVGKWYQRVTWGYPATSILQPVSAAGIAPQSESKSPAGGLARGISVDQLNFDYSISGGAAFRPVQVIDDGTFTWLQMPSKLQDWPAVFWVTPDNRYAALTPVPDGRYLKVTKVVHKLLLKIGKEEVEITNNRAVQ
ncbi:TrbG/VirB9 family P-type conjugative transfer protein [Ralstonia pickettii]|uniref:TrbG/VirB9 family P-type conjugative transfer protein n=1 Tax=Ralstonia pickettii TaxID=329 RepID=A0AAW4Q803_RALPI|nr:TrbG/VirB9 family P-type conjugative transfer protein [Ralstonia pickettii]MBA9846722.1 type IV secretion system protein VirB9 [Ralstonia pickettii]MBA9852126.1 type IV secretion system protein VirB9 [Ralstonia pickettii]MBA9919860.1 type IV secretion system protein VirB9 [Ralstonia pickettii]MBA9958962.1 type IV secretion system protein VirB9 [Ralstonia pickettii]MBA9964660.1 type IV secretion system protein VirB9 [Ralstonia pickettii]